MLHAWNLITLAFCAALALLSLLRGIAGLIVARGALPRLESATLCLASVAGWIGIALIYHQAV